MRRELTIAAGPGEWRAALVENGVPVELRVERRDGFEADSIHLGRVLRLLPALGAALVDIGGDRPAFLPQSEILPRGRRLDEGERVLVQIRREAQGGKAPRLSTGVLLRGQLVELIIGRSGIIGAEALSPEDHAQLLRAASINDDPSASQAAPSPCQTNDSGRAKRRSKIAIGLRVQKSKPVEALAAEAMALRLRCEDLVDLAGRCEPPARLHPAPTFAAALAGVMPPIGHILVDDPASVPEIRSAFPDAVVEQMPETAWPFDLDALFDEALAPTLALPGGASIHIEPARAAVMIDVDSGTPETGSPARTALAVDLAAAEAIGRQIRRRHLAGGIVIDFVGLDDRGSRDRVRAALGRALAGDPMQSQILGWTRLGHLELVRRRRTRSLFDALLEPTANGGFIKTAVTVVHEALRALRREARAQPGRAWRLTIAPEVAAALGGGEAAAALLSLEQRFGRTIPISADDSLDRTRFQITPV